MSDRRSLLLSGLVAAGAILAGCAFAAEPGRQPVDPPVGEPRYPDLAVAPLSDVQIGVAPDGTRLLFFTATLVNIGDGPLLISAERSRWRGWRITQYVAYSDGGHEVIDVPASMVYGGDGHNHWHIAEAARYRLLRVDDGPDEPPRFDEKAGFCFFDQSVFRDSLPGTPAESQHATHDCGTSEEDRSITMGLSVGWGDQYHWFLPRQSIDVTGLPDGRYRLEAVVDPEGWLIEVPGDNNVTWIEFDIVTRAEDGLPLVEIVDESPPV